MLHRKSLSFGVMILAIIFTVYCAVSSDSFEIETASTRGLVDVRNTSTPSTMYYTSEPTDLVAFEPLEESTRAPRRKDTGQAKYMYFANTNGRHSNQLKALAHALLFSQKLKRILIIPPFLSPKSKVSELYDLAKLRTRYEFAEEHEFLESKARSEVGTDVVCFQRRGIPNVVPRKLFSCTKYGDLTSRNVSKTLNDVERQGAGSSMIYFYEVLYYDSVDVSCVWHLLRPHTSIAQSVDRLLLPNTLVVHVRSLERTCHDRLRKLFSRTAIGRHVGPSLWQCDMKPHEVIAIVEKDMEVSSQNINTKRIQNVYVAHDGQNLKAVNAFYAGAKSNGWNVIPYQSPSSTTLNLLPFFIDFWMAVEAEGFVGNQASTVSVNVCGIRRARGRSCLGWVWGVNPNDVSNPECGG
eukprot:PhF_6_TR30764/c0_g1_i1/m.45311